MLSAGSYRRTNSKDFRPNPKSTSPTPTRMMTMSPRNRPGPDEARTDLSRQRPNQEGDEYGPLMSRTEAIVLLILVVLLVVLDLIRHPYHLVTLQQAMVG